MLGRAFDEQPGRKNQEIRGNVEYLHSGRVAARAGIAAPAHER